MSAAVNIACAAAVEADSWQNGLEGAWLQVPSNGCSEVLSVIVGLVLLLLFNFKECRKMFRHFSEEVRNNNRRSNAFDERSSIERRLTVLVMLLYGVSGGVLLSALVVWTHGLNPGTVGDVGLCVRGTSVFGAYCVLEIITYSVVGYTFAGGAGSRKWVRAFTVSQSLAAVPMCAAALAAMFHGGWPAAWLAVGAASYFAARLVFIVMGFRTFFDNLFSLVYFILYLCALEIIPLVHLYQVALLTV